MKKTEDLEVDEVRMASGWAQMSRQVVDKCLEVKGGLKHLEAQSDGLLARQAWEIGPDPGEPGQEPLHFSPGL